MAFVLDSFPASSGAYSSRRLLTSYVANKAFQVRRASDNATLDVGFLANGDLDDASLTAFLAATTGSYTTWYSQSGSNDLLQATAANQPTVTQAGQGGHTVATFVKASAMTMTGTFSPTFTDASVALVGAATTIASAFYEMTPAGVVNTGFSFFSDAGPIVRSRRLGIDDITKSASLAVHRFSRAVTNPTDHLVIDQGAPSDVAVVRAYGAVAVSRIGRLSNGVNALDGFIAELVVFTPHFDTATETALDLDQKTYWIDGISPPFPSVGAGSIGTGGGGLRRGRRRIEDQPLLYHPPVRRPWEKADAEPVSTPPAPPVVSPPKAAPPPVVVAPLDFSAERRDLAALRAELAGVQADLDDEADMLDYLDATE